MVTNIREIINIHLAVLAAVLQVPNEESTYQVGEKTNKQDVVIVVFTL